MLTPSKLIILIFLFPLLDYSTGRYLQLLGMPYRNDLTRVFIGNPLLIELQTRILTVLLPLITSTENKETYSLAEGMS